MISSIHLEIHSIHIIRRILILNVDIVIERPFWGESPFQFNFLRGEQRLTDLNTSTRRFWNCIEYILLRFERWVLHTLDRIQSGQ